MAVLLRPCARARCASGLALALVAACPSAPSASTARGTGRAISALGRLEPGEGVIRVAGPSGPAAVISELLVEEGDFLERGQTLAILGSHALHRAVLSRREAELENARQTLERMEQLSRRDSVAPADLDRARLAQQVASAAVQTARAELDLSLVVAPVSGRVLEIHAREGERLGPEGLLEIGETQRMYAVAEVYETDIGRVRTGQRARVESPALAGPLGGTVEAIGLKIGKMDALASDPVAKTDARVVEVRIRLDPGHRAEGLTNLQVSVEIEPDTEKGNSEERRPTR